MLLFTCIQLRKPLRFLCRNKSIKTMFNINLFTTRVHPNKHRTHHRQRTTLDVSDSFCIVLERYFRFEVSLLSILCMLIARMEMGTSRVLGYSDIIT